MLGYLDGGFETWKSAGEPIDIIVDIEPDELMMDIPFDPNLLVVDVRKEAEFGDGHLPDAHNLPLDTMNDIVELANLEETQNLYVHCAGGYRSVIACSLLKRHGFHNIRNVLGGWEKIKELENVKIVKEPRVLN
jgi:rhodanese-related sulfurtransferase